MVHKIMQIQASVDVHRGKCDLCDFRRGMVVGDKWAGLSISETFIDIEIINIEK